MLLLQLRWWCCCSAVAVLLLALVLVLVLVLVLRRHAHLAVHLIDHLTRLYRFTWVAALCLWSFSNTGTGRGNS